MAVRDNQMVQNLVTIAPVKFLHNVVQECYTSEATRTTALAIVAPAAVRATST